MFLEISQNSQKKTCASVSFVLRPEACNYIKDENLARVFSCEFCKISKNTFFTEHLRWLFLSLDIFSNLYKLKPCDFERTVSDKENTGREARSSTMHTKELKKY